MMQKTKITLCFSIASSLLLVLSAKAEPSRVDYLLSFRVTNAISNSLLGATAGSIAGGGSALVIALNIPSATNPVVLSLILSGGVSVGAFAGSALVLQAETYASSQRSADRILLANLQEDAVAFRVNHEDGGPLLQEAISSLRDAIGKNSSELSDEDIALAITHAELL